MKKTYSFEKSAFQNLCAIYLKLTYQLKGALHMFLPKNHFPHLAARTVVWIFEREFKIRTVEFVLESSPSGRESVLSDIQVPI